MATGTISSLGVGSGLELQSILEQLREVDQQVISRKETEVTILEAQLNEFTVVNNKLLTMKSKALDLSLSSTFLSRTASSSDESVFTASVSDGTAVQTTPITVGRIATQSTFKSDGKDSQDAIVYVPTSFESTSGVANSAPGGDVVMAIGESMTINYGGTTDITVTAVADMSMEELRDAINDVANNPGGEVVAETFVIGTETFLRVKATSGGTGEANRLAITEGMAALDFVAPQKTFAYNMGGADTVTLNIAADTTMSQLVGLINDDANNPGVTASIIDDGSATTPYKLILQADGTGQDNEISMLAQLPDLTMTVQGETGANLNAEITLNGIAYQRQTNSISDVISGVTLNLESAGTASLTVANNNAAVKELVVGLVEAYNAAIQEISGNTGYDENTEQFGILARTTLRDMPYDLQNLMTSSIKADSEGLVTTLFDLGLEFNRDGTITIDESVLDVALSAAPESISALFLGDDDQEITGLADKINDYLREVSGGDGQVAAEKSAAQLRIDDLELRIETETERLDKKYEILAKQFIELDSYMNQMTSMSNYLTSQFDSLSSMLSSSSSK